VPGQQRPYHVKPTSANPTARERRLARALERDLNRYAAPHLESQLLAAATTGTTGYWSMGLSESFGQLEVNVAAKVLARLQTQAAIVEALRREPSKARRAPLCWLYAMLATELP
jgi:hypothetical protein